MEMVSRITLQNRYWIWSQETVGQKVWNSTMGKPLTLGFVTHSDKEKFKSKKDEINIIHHLLSSKSNNSSVR